MGNDEGYTLAIPQNQGNSPMQEPNVDVSLKF